MKKNIIFISLLVYLISTVSCSKTEVTTDDTRSFFMGVTPWPADFTNAEVDTAYAFINDHCDLVSHHFDDGIPYEEAFTGQAFPTSMQQDVQYRKTKTAANKKILLSVAALNLTRLEKSDYYAKSTVSASIKNAWKLLAFNDPKVVTAYLNYISWLIDTFQPSFVNFGVESNSASFSVSAFAKYKDFLSQVYARLKIKYPGIPFFISFMVDETNEGFSNATQLLPFTDYIGLSAYPYVTVSSSGSGNTNPALFPANYFEKFINMANKPLAFAETGYIAENLSIPSYNLNKQGNDNWQKDYLELVYKLCNQHRAKLLIWFCSKDYDAGNAWLIANGLYQDFFALWQDTGLKDQNGRKRPAYNLWLNWMARKKTE